VQHRLNRTVFREEPTADPIQAIINKHTYEDDYHWLWFLEDLEKLGLNPSATFTDTLKFLWSEETSVSRRVAYELYRHTVAATPIQKLVVIETVEATGNIALSVCSQVVRELQILNQQQEYRYFGVNHLIVDSEHYCTYKAKHLVENIQLTQEEKNECLKLVEQIFLTFMEYVSKLLTYAKLHSFDQALPEAITQRAQILKPIGSYLLEAGLLTIEQLHEALSQQRSIPIPIGQILASQGWVNQQTIEYLMEKVIYSERQLTDAKNVSCIWKEKSEDKNGSRIFSKASETSSPKPMRLGTYLIEAALINTEQLQTALNEQEFNSIPIGQILSRNGLVNQTTIEYLMEKIVLPERKIAVLN
jgi:hypothetical protein